MYVVKTPPKQCSNASVTVSDSLVLCPYTDNLQYLHWTKCVCLSDILTQLMFNMQL